MTNGCAWNGCRLSPTADLPSHASAAAMSPIAGVTRRPDGSRALPPSVSVSVAVAARLALHLLFVLAFFPFPLDLAAVGGAELELAIRFAPVVIATPAVLAALVLPGSAQVASATNTSAVAHRAVHKDILIPFSLVRDQRLVRAAVPSRGRYRRAGSAAVRIPRNYWLP